MKHFVYKYFGLIVVCLLPICFLIAVSLKDRHEILIPLFATAISLIFFLQKLKLEELRLFVELFKGFTQRFDDLNEKLNQIISSHDDLTSKEQDILFDYFNLCGEEYLYYKEGYILPSVWKAWKNGMKIYFSNERVERLWNKECSTDSYYGFKPF